MFLWIKFQTTPINYMIENVNIKVKKTMQNEKKRKSKIKTSIIKKDKICNEYSDFNPGYF